MDNGSSGVPYLPPRPPSPSLPPPPVSPTFPSVAPATLPVVDTATPSGSGRGKRIGAVAGVAALLAAGTFAVVQITGNDSAGGAASPQEVGTLLVESLDSADVLGVIDLLLPGERETMREPMIEMFDNMRRLGVLADDASLSGIGGFELDFADIQVVAEPTNVDDISNVAVSGSVTASIDGSKVPIGDLIIDDLLGGERPDMSMDASTEEFDDLRFTAVEQDGRWYMSLFHSVAERARGDRPIPAEPITARGADTPEGAVDALLTAVQDKQLGVALGLLDPTEFEAVQRYAPLFLADAQQALDDAGIVWSITDRAYTVDGSGNRRAVTIDSLAFQASIDGQGEIDLRYADDCLTATFDGETVESCLGEPADMTGMLDDAGISDTESYQDMLDAFTSAFEGSQQVGSIAVHEVDGEWYVSPMRTGFDAMNAFLGELEREELTAMIDSVEGFFSALGDELLMPGFDDDGWDDGSDDGSDDGWDMDADFEALNACTVGDDAAVALACIQSGVAAGTIDPSVVNMPVRHPECGVAELYVLGDVYFMEDAPFVDAMVAASPCVLDLIRSGAVDSFEVPYELIAPECLLGVNWYTDDDSAANDAFFECAEAVRLSL